MFVQVEQPDRLGPTRVIVVIEHDEPEPAVEAVKALLMLAFIKQGFSFKEGQVQRLPPPQQGDNDEQ